MSAGFGAFEIARSGMHVNERGLFATGHNISNVNTPGYSRQQSVIATGPYIGVNGGKYQIGLGASVQETRQIRHMFLDNIYRLESTTLGYWETRAKTFNDIEAILAEPLGSGLQEVMNQFWDSWQELSKDPSSLTARAMVRQRAESLVYHINHVGMQLDRLQQDLNSELQVRIDEVNDITRQIAYLNVEILKIEVTNDKANDYRDQRNSLLDRLSKLLDIEVTEMQDGQLDITCGGYFLVHRDKNTNIYAQEKSPGDIFFTPMLEDPEDIELPVKGGIIKGLLESRGEYIYPDTDVVEGIDVDGDGVLDTLKYEDTNSLNIVSELKRRLDYLVNTLAIEVNKLHKSGKTLGNPPNDGEGFFVPLDPAYPMRMSNIKLNDTLLDLNNIVASKNGDSGDNTISLQIANLRQIPLLINDKGVLTLDSYYQSIIQEIGNGGAEATRISENQNMLVISADSQRQSIMGVSLDEEMSNMMKYQFGYSASARIMNILDEMIDTVVNRMGITGR
jgi:flagellar hook-associated protein 1 FlgK